MQKLILVAALLSLTGTSALAQPSLDQQNARNIVRGIHGENTSGQIGEAAIDRRNNRIVVRIQGTKGSPEAVTIERGSTCGPAARPLVATLGTLHDGRLTATLPLGADRLLSGNYDVVVHNNTPVSRSVACGHLYL
jgi:hypothetical protein